MTSATAAADIVFYIQASATVGMGHLARSAALIDALERRGIDSRVVLRVDEQGRTLARDKGLTAREIAIVDDTLATTQVVIDAVTLSSGDVRALSGCPRRILVSPVCDRAEIATHVFLRAVPERLRERLASDCVVVEDPAFAYATAASLDPRDLDFNGPLVVGLCMSGGADQPGIDALVRAARAAPGVDVVYVLHPETPVIAGEGPPVKHRPFDNEPWDFFAPINVFVTGDGVMMAEAVAQALPCLSVTRPGAAAKNHGLIEAGCVTVAGPDEAPTALAALLSDRSRLDRMHHATLTQGGAQDADALASAVAELAPNRRT